MNVRHVHFSGRYDATPAELTEACERLIPDCDVLTLTEVGAGKHQRALADVARAHGWPFFSPSSKPGMDECAVLWNPAVLTPSETRTLRLSPLVLRTARKAPLYALAVLLAPHGDGAPFWLTTAHKPAHVEGATRLRRVWAGVVYRSALHGWKRKAGRLRRRSGVHRVVFAADWNLNLKRRWVRAYLHAAWPNLQVGYRRGYNGVGSHGFRAIDGVLTNLPIETPTRVLRSLAGFDHRPVLTVLTIPKEK